MSPQYQRAFLRLLCENGNRYYFAAIVLEKRDTNKFISSDPHVPQHKELCVITAVRRVRLSSSHNPYTSSDHSSLCTQWHNKLMNGTPNTGNASRQSRLQNRFLTLVRTLKQTYSQDFPRVPLAFKNSMTHEFCKSHYLSQFATFFIDVGAKTSPATGCVSIDDFHIQMIFDSSRLPFTSRHAQRAHILQLLNHQHHIASCFPSTTKFMAGR